MAAAAELGAHLSGRGASLRGSAGLPAWEAAGHERNGGTGRRLDTANGDNTEEAEEGSGEQGALIERRISEQVPGRYVTSGSCSIRIHCRKGV